MEKKEFRIPLETKEFRIIFISLLGGLLLGLLIGGYMAAGYRNQVEKLKEEIREVREKLAEKTVKTGEETVALYFIEETGTEAYLVPERRTIPRTGEPHLAAVKELIKGPKTEGLQPVFSPRTKVRGLKIEDGLAVIDLSREAGKTSRGAWGEALAVSAVVNTLTKFPEVEEVRILIEGKEVETLSGHMDLTGPLRRNEQVVKVR